MAFHPPVHRELVRALRILAAFEMPYAEARRLLRPVAARLGVPRPSYASVRRLVIAEQERKRRRADALEGLLAGLFTGRLPVRARGTRSRGDGRRLGDGRAGCGGPGGRAASGWAPPRYAGRPARRPRSSSALVTGRRQAKRSQT
ncbi:MAG TPA: hypothetical protein VFR63_12995 [Gaiellaceae bacterium]|nr:hypothetical protein [Gaiellaceae bacterium]